MTLQEDSTTAGTCHMLAPLSVRLHGAPCHAASLGEGRRCLRWFGRDGALAR